MCPELVYTVFLLSIKCRGESRVTNGVWGEKSNNMYEMQKLRASVEQILTAAAEEIFGVFKRSIAEIEEKLIDASVNNDRNQRLTDDVNQTECTILIQNSWMVKQEQEQQEQQERSPSLDVVDPEPPHIKVEENLWTNQEGEQLQGLEEADITKFSSTPPLVKSEYDEDKAQTSQLHQSQTEENTKEPEDGDDCEGSEPDTIQNNDVPISNVTCRTTRQGTKDDKTCKLSSVLKKRMTVKTKKKPFNCSVCKKVFTHSGNFNQHMLVHTGERPFRCSLCKKGFIHNGNLNRHMLVHTGEKPFRCSICKKGFIQNASLSKHMLVHTGERPFKCSICKKGFMHNISLNRHMLVHTGERPFRCSVCKKGFTHRGNLNRHMLVHTGERPFTCSVCKKGFTHSDTLKNHMLLHTGERPYSCTGCEKGFASKQNLKRHMLTHT